ncbi:hypothetical protein STAS_16951 [Striga asiatica]|uniref:FLZ-type domain-containing protein n=1 Tax=Striga asiatica TaxID=4170 RepID=A0A5A7Q5F0_STRAF|nr:hypothetical protein STAS_16951 [Striga asiatica]
MTEFTLDLNNPPSDHFNAGDQIFPAAARPHHRSSGEFVQTANFLRVCFLCNRRLVQGRDIYIYRGDSAFCSLECRQQKMSEDERKEKYSSAMEIDRIAM